MFNIWKSPCVFTWAYGTFKFKVQVSQQQCQSLLSSVAVCCVVLCVVSYPCRSFYMPEPWDYFFQDSIFTDHMIRDHSSSGQ